MGINRNKVLDAARKHQSRGQYDKAIAQYKKLVDADKRDVRSLLKIGDLYAAHIEPVVPYAIRGVLWDQGEGGSDVQLLLTASEVVPRVDRLEPAVGTRVTYGAGGMSPAVAEYVGFFPGSLQTLFGTAPIEAIAWVRILLVGASVLLLVELEKALLRRQSVPCWKAGDFR